MRACREPEGAWAVPCHSRQGHTCKLWDSAGAIPKVAKQGLGLMHGSSLYALQVL